MSGVVVNTARIVIVARGAGLLMRWMQMSHSFDCPSKLAELKESIRLMSLSVTAWNSTYELLLDLTQRVYSLEQDNARLTATVRVQGQQLQSLEQRYSQVLYRLSETSRG